MWPHYPAVRELLLSRAAAIVDPIMVLQAENDYSTAPTPALLDVFQRSGITHRGIIYPPHGEGPEDGHAFCALGARSWGPDVQDFLADVGVISR
jgi:hypothetical protein